MPAKTDKRRLGELACLFLKLGTTGFGGPAAHIGMFEDEVVRRRGWLTREEFMDLLGATNLIPGPNSTEMAIHIGHRRAGWPGLLVAGACFILPATLIATIIAWAYVRYGTLPQAEGILYGIKPVIIAVVLQALWGLGRTALKNRLLAFVAVTAAVTNALGVNELAVLFGAGSLLALIQSFKSRKRPPAHAILPPFIFKSPLLAAATTGAVSAGAAATPFGVWPLFLFFLKVGAVLYGSGYVLLAFLRGDLVERFGWLTEAQLLDAIAVGQMMPGPLFTTATFIGYLLGGLPAAALATLGIFLPAFFFVAISGPLIPRLRRSPLAGAALDGVNAASLALMAVVTFHLGTAALVDWLTLLLAGGAAFALFRYRVTSTWLVAGGSAAGLLKVWLM
ncbi:MAG: chromate efflux transporter [Verrucomicrobia bacterium]|nr:chromate efflux transporter [Verrucomicrobiota bacterium]